MILVFLCLAIIWDNDWTESLAEFLVQTIITAWLLPLCLIFETWRCAILSAIVLFFWSILFQIKHRDIWRILIWAKNSLPECWSKLAIKSAAGNTEQAPACWLNTFAEAFLLIKKCISLNLVHGRHQTISSWIFTIAQTLTLQVQVF